jgi:hypothetical protein
LQLHSASAAITFAASSSVGFVLATAVDAHTTIIAIVDILSIDCLIG